MMLKKKIFGTKLEVKPEVFPSFGAKFLVFLSGLKQE